MANIIFILRAVQALLAVIVLGLIAYFINYIRNATYGGSLDSANFMLFDSIWTLFIALPYLVFAPRHFPALAHQYALLGIEGATLIFWFSAFIALAVDISGLPSCTACNAVKAAVAFGALEWATFVATFGLNIMPVINGRRTTAPAVHNQPTV